MKCPTCGSEQEENDLEEGVSELPRSKIEKVRILVLVPFPSGKPFCMKCGDTEVTHSCVMEIIHESGEKGKGFGCLCTACAKALDDLKPVLN